MKIVFIMFHYKYCIYNISQENYNYNKISAESQIKLTCSNKLMIQQAVKGEKFVYGITMMHESDESYTTECVNLIGHM